eukprot:TRINITY_DN6645_c0_g2_i1.p1 TRINITY_DN6645_c0_g2~~TRINITY_DN6645_c0_g2_i1.p1  ORF type:complete len:138 (-),score=21.60 TRINITY_DN6645_c0_g2_i1:76-489(-)
MGRRGRTDAERGLGTLVCVLQALVGVEIRIIVELRNEMIICGSLDFVDEKMNLWMLSAECESLKFPMASATPRFDQIYVPGHNIRFVHLPNEVDPNKAVASLERRQDDARGKFKRGLRNKTLDRQREKESRTVHAKD